LLGPLINLAPGIRFFQRRTTERAIAHIRHRDLHGVFVHPDIETEIIAGHDRVLREIFRHSPSDHEQSALFRRDLNFRKLKYIFGRIDAEMLVWILVLMMNQAKARTAIAEGRAKDRYLFLE